MSASSEAEETAQFTVLTEFLTGAVRSQESSVSLPDEIVALFKKGLIQDDSSIRAFNKLFGSSDHTNRLRLDYGAFINVVAILLHLPYSHYQEKLLFAFMHTIDLLKDPEAVQATLKRTRNISISADEIEVKRRKINNKLIHKMMQVLVLDEQEASMRLMASHILFALLRGSVEAQEIARKQSAIAKLGPLVDSDEDYILRIFTANTIREMCTEKSEPHEFWPQRAKKKKNRHSDFPLAQSPDSAWLGAVSDYLSNQDVSRGFHGNSQPLVSRLLSISSPSHTFDDPGVNILAVVAEKFLFVIPGTTTTPLAFLEFVLDPQCKCSIDEYTSPDFRAEVSDHVDVIIDTAKRGHQIFKGVKSALDSARLTFPQNEHAETFAKYASENLKHLPPLPGREDVDTSSCLERRKFRRLDLGMIDMSMDIESEDEMTSASDISSLVGADAHNGRQTPSKSRSRQSSQNVVAKLKDAKGDMCPVSASFVSHGSLVLGGQGDQTTQPQTIDPRILTKGTGNAVQADATAGIDTNVNFATYIDQSRTRAEKEVVRSKAETTLTPPEPRRDTILLQRVESSPSNRAQRPISKRAVAETLEASKRRPPAQTMETEQLFAQDVTANKMQEHRGQIASRVESTTLESITLASNTSTATFTKTDTIFKKPETRLLRSYNPQRGGPSPMDWDTGDMADESTALPAAKKPRLTNSVARPGTKKSQADDESQEVAVHPNDRNATSMLKRPKPNRVMSQSQQIDAHAEHDQYDIAVDDNSTAPASKTAKATSKRVSNMPSERAKSQVPKSAKGASAKSAAKERKVLQPMSTKISVASTRPRRSQPKSKRYIDDSDSNPESPNEASLGAPQKPTVDALSRKPTLARDTNLQKPAVSAVRIEADEVQSDHKVATATNATVQHSTKTTTNAKPHETLVVASPPQLDQADTQLFGEESQNAHCVVEAGQEQAHPQEATDAAGDKLLDETAEDSYPMASGKIQGVGVSFGTKLRQIIQDSGSHGKKTGVMATYTTPLSNAKSFIGSVNETRHASTKKPHRSTPATSLRGDDAEDSQDPGTLGSWKEKVVDGGSLATTVKSGRQAAATASGNATIMGEASTGAIRPRKVAQNVQLTEARGVDNSKELSNQQRQVRSERSTIASKADKPSTRPITQQEAEINEDISKQEDVNTLAENVQSLAPQQAAPPHNTNTPIDLTQDSDDAMSVSGPGAPEDTQDGFEHTEDKPATRSHVVSEQNNPETLSTRPFEQASRKSAGAVQPKLHVLEDGPRAKTPQKAKLRTPAMLPQRQDLAASRIKVPMLEGPATKKAQLVHFDQRGPQNQGIPSPDKQAQKSVPAFGTQPGTESQIGHKQRHSSIATASPFAEAPVLQAKLSNAVVESNYHDPGILVEDDTIMEGVDEPVQEDHEDSPSEESAPALTHHLQFETFKNGKSASQGSRVDQNGSPRLQPQSLVVSNYHEVSAMDVTSEAANDHREMEEDNPAASTEESELASEDNSSQRSDLSFRPENEAPVARQSERSIRTRTEATVTHASPQKITKQVERKVAANTMKAKQPPRESLGLSKIVQEQYPQAQNEVTTVVFKKPALKTAIAKPLEVSAKMPQSIARSNSTPEPLGPTPASLRTVLLVNQADKYVEKEDTILDNLNRGKTFRRAAEDVDRTLVEGDIDHHYHRRRTSDESSVSSVSPPHKAEHRKSFHHDEMLWRKGSRNAQTSIRDALLEITNTILFRLESEEKAIELKVTDYDVGCCNIIKEFRATGQKSFEYTGRQLLNNATARMNQLESAFDRLQDSKDIVRKADTKDQMQRAIKLRQNLMLEQIEHMLDKERDRVSEGVEAA